MHYFLLLMTTFVLMACGNKPEVAIETQVQEKPQTPELTAVDSQKLAKQYFLEGLNYQYANKLDYAALFFDKALTLDSKSEYLRKALAETQRQIGQSQSALITLKKNNISLDSLSEESLLLLAHLSLDLNQPDSADVYYDILTRKNPSNGKYWWEWAQSLEEAKNYNKLVDVNLQLLPIMEYPEQFIYRQLLLYSISKRQQEVPAFLEDVYANTQNIRWLKEAQERYEKEGQQVKSIELLNKLIELEPLNADYRRKKAQSMEPAQAGAYLWKAYRESIPLAIAAKDSAQSEELTMDSDNELPNHQPFASFPLDAARLLVYGKDYSQAKIIVDTLLQIQPQSAEVWSLASGIDFMMGDTATAIEASFKAWQYSQEQFKYANLLIKMLKTTGDFQRASNWLDSVRVLNKDPLLLNTHMEVKLSQVHFYNSEHYNDPQFKTLVRDLNQGILAQADSLLAIPPNGHPAFPSQYLLLYRKAITLERLNSLKEVQEIFEKLLVDDPKNPALLNYYGYTLIDRDIDVAKGQVLVERALSVEPNSTAYLDSKAWGLHKMGKHQEALDILLKIKAKRENDFYILEHIAHCYKALNQLDQYQKVLESIKQLAPHHPILSPELEVKGNQ